MKKSQANNILENQTKRRNVLLSLIFIIIIVSIITLSFFLMYFNKNKKQYINYNEKSNVDYNVFLKDNDFFEDKYLRKGNQYIASLIDYINVDFNYRILLEENNVKYKYSYRIEADVAVKEKDTNNNLYTNSKILLSKEERTTDTKELNINEKINVDYNYYNDIIKDFVNIYGLDNTESTLTVSMYINTIGTCENIENSKEKESVISIVIPLTTKTVAIDISNNLINENNILLCKNNKFSSIPFIVFGVLFLTLDIYLIVFVIKYIIKTRTAENIYERELKKILNNYSSYIQNLGNDFEFNNYQVLKVNTFTDMLEIRDTIKQPILMKENDDKTGAYFVIPSSTKILYVYRLKVSDIKKNNNDERNITFF